MIALDEDRLLGELAPLLDDDGFRRGLANLSGDAFFMAFFLTSVSQGEGLGEAAVGMIGQEELASRLRELARQEAEERGHKEQTLDVARALYPRFFSAAGDYRYAEALEGRAYYVAVLQANRARLEARGRYSRLNLYLTTTLAYELMVLLLYRAVADAVRKSPLPPPERDRIASLLDGILAEEETHVGIVEQHNALLAAERAGLSDEARDQLDLLAALDEDDYRAAAGDAVGQVVAMTRRYADAARFRSEIERAAQAS